MSFDFLPDYEIADLLKYEVPNLPAKAGWTVDLIKFREVCKEIGIQHPVRIKYKGKGNEGLAGFREGKHVISLKNYTRADTANETLWHELAHCLQLEEVQRQTDTEGTYEFNKAYNREGRTGQAYRNNRFEVQAREFAKANKHIMLIKEV